MKKNLLMAVLLMAASAKAQTVSEPQARQIAEQFFQGKLKNHKIKELNKASAQAVELAYQKDDAYYIYNNGMREGFVIVSGNDNAKSRILGWSDNGPFDYDSAPCGLKALLERYGLTPNSLSPNSLSPVPSPKERGVNSAGAGNAASESDYAPLLGRGVGGEASLPRRGVGGEASFLLTTQWNQYAPYNDECPLLDNGEHGLTGCVITAMAQIINYWQWPKQGRGAHRHGWGDFDFYRDFSTSTYDWESMIDNYDTTDYTDTQAQAVSRLMADVGCAIDAHYAQTTSAYTRRVARTFVKYFGYSETAHIYGDVEGENENWNKDLAIMKELDAGRPVWCSIRLATDDAHAVVIDGYSDDFDDDGDRLFHWNFGWGGHNDGWFSTYPMDALVDYVDDIVIGIEPSHNPWVSKNGVTMELADGEGRVMCVNETPEGESYDISLPETVEHEGKTYNMTGIYEHAFHNSSISGIAFPGTMKNIPAHLFDASDADNLGRLTSLSLAEGIEEIGDGAFFMCKGLSGMLTLPSTIRRIGDEAFLGADYFNVYTEAKGFTIGESNFNCRVFDGLENAAEIGTAGVNGLAGTFTVNPATKYHPYAVRAEKVKIPASASYELDCVIPYFGYEVAEGHPSLCSRDSVLYNRDKTTLLRFPSKYDIDMLVIPAGVTTIDSDASLWGMHYLTLPASAKNFDGAFTSPNLRTVTIFSPTPPAVSEDTFDPSIHQYGQSVLRVPAGSKALYEAAPVWKDFANIVEEVSIDGPLVYLPEYGMATVVGRNTDYDFNGSLQIPERVTINGEEWEVGNVSGDAFLYDEAIREVSIPATVYSMGNGGEPFVTCPNIHTISVADGNDTYHVTDGMLIESKWGRNTLAYCPPMKKEGNSIVARDRVTIPSDVDIIGWHVFADNLRSVTIPASVWQMKPTAFRRCKDLMEVRCLGEEPPYYDQMYRTYGHSFHEDVFKPEHGTVLYVPAGCTNTYSREDEWDMFPFIREIGDEATNIYSIEHSTWNIEHLSLNIDHSTAVYDLGGRRVMSPTAKGLYIMGSKKVIVK